MRFRPVPLLVLQCPTHETETSMNDDLMRRMRGHVGYDPKQVLANPERYNRAERRAAARVMAEQGRKQVR